MKEWANPWNSFNSIYKGLTYYEHYKAINEWKLGKREKPLPPIEISLDLILQCQLRCNFCNTGKYLQERGIEKMTDEHLINILNFFAKWKYKELGICWGGGGESTLHPKIWDGLLLSSSLEMENAIATNAIAIDTDEKAEIAVKTCRWIGVSIDASNKLTYKKLRNVDLFDKAIENIKRLVEAKKRIKNNCDIGYKFLLFKENQYEIYEAAKLAKSLNVRDFHCRPCDLRHQGKIIKDKAEEYDIESIKKQFELVHELSDENFNVITAIHKFNDDFTPKKEAEQCFAAPLGIQICPDGGIYYCPDTRRIEHFKLGNHYPDVNEIEKIWGNKKHYDLTFINGTNHCTSRCTWTCYNNLCDKLAIKKDDPLCRNFI